MAGGFFDSTGIVCSIHLSKICKESTKRLDAAFSTLSRCSAVKDRANKDQLLNSWNDDTHSSTLSRPHREIFWHSGSSKSKVNNMIGFVLEDGRSTSECESDRKSVV